MRFRKRPVEIEAIRVTLELVEAVCAERNLPDILSKSKYMGNIDPYFGEDEQFIIIKTLEGSMRADIGDWIIKEPFPTDDREIYPCKPDIFEKTYEVLE